jgi:CRISPR-associated protein (TIGR03986 family)
MIEGTVVSYKNNNGEIRGDDGETYAFNRKAIAEGDLTQAVPGRRVRFEPEGQRARGVTLLPEVVHLPDAPKKPAGLPPAQPGGRPGAGPALPPNRSPHAAQQAQGGQAPRPGFRPATVGRAPDASGYRFLNPYNFVRWLRPPQTFGDETELLARCAPPPHDRYVGLSGTISCQLEAVTPLFIADAELAESSEEDQKRGHKTYRFFRYDFGSGHEPALPASSLRGMLRSVFEAATNSCYAHFNYDARLSYHLPANEALKLVPGRVEYSEQKGWQLRLLPGTARLVINDRPHDKLYAGRVERYEALAPGRRRTDRGGRPGSVPKLFKPAQLGDLCHGEACFALLQELQFPPVWNVLAVARQASDLRPGPGQRVVSGYLCLNNQNIESKRFERFFFRDPSNTSGTELVPLPEPVRAKYADLLADYQDRHKDTIKKWRERGDQPDHPRIEKDDQGRVKKEAAFSRFVIGGPKTLQAGDLVYAMLSGSVQEPRVEFLVPVAVPRVGYERKPAQLLPRHLWKCEDYDHLCPACRTFGWVYGHEDSPEQKIEQRAAYAGRIRLQHGRLIESQRAAPRKFPSPVTLAILSTPKPTTTRFYLRSGGKSLRTGLDDYQVGYDNSENVLRGRKLYRHHGHGSDEGYWTDKNREYRIDKKSDQNRTLDDALLPGSRFEFELHFENLAPVELGALLWTLQLEGSQYHRLGLGKPLGFGSVRLTVDEGSVRLLEPEERYTSLMSAAERPASAEERQFWLDSFKAAMARAYESKFEELPSIKDLLALLSDPPLALPIHYPRPDVRPSEEGRNYEWFIGNNRNPRARLVLELPGEERGLPLIDKTGVIKG